jgi:hypothetical protein
MGRQVGALPATPLQINKSTKMKQLYTLLLVLVSALILSWAVPALVCISVTTALLLYFMYESELGRANLEAPDSATYHVLDADTLRQYDTPYVIHAADNRWNAVARWLFPVYLTRTNRHTEYL